ncbi:hypothetical protein ACLOJK_018948 [Asimina triloba]
MFGHSKISEPKSEAASHGPPPQQPPEYEQAPSIGGSKRGWAQTTGNEKAPSTEQPGRIPIAQGLDGQQRRGLAIQIHISHVATIKKEFYSITAEFPTVHRRSK